jgi:hypothetical protein
MTASTIVVAAGPPISGGVSEPSGLATNLAGRIAVAAPLEDGIEVVVCAGLVGIVWTVDPWALERWVLEPVLGEFGVEEPGVEVSERVLLDPPPQAPSSRIKAPLPRNEAMVRRLIESSSSMTGAIAGCGSATHAAPPRQAVATT